MIKTAVDVVGLDDVNEGGGIHLFYFPDHKFGLFPGDHRVQQSQVIMAVTALSGELGGAVVGEILDLLIDFLRVTGDNEERVLFVSLVENLDCLGTGELEDNGVQCGVPAE